MKLKLNFIYNLLKTLSFSGMLTLTEAFISLQSQSTGSMYHY